VIPGKVIDPISMQSAQFLANSRWTSHPSAAVTGRPHGDRPTRKATQQYCFNNRINPFINQDGNIPDIAYNKGVATLHTDSCPRRSSSSHSVQHIFDCPAAPTLLKPINLWERPLEAASFVSFLPSFSHLSLISPSPPPQPCRGTGSVGLPLRRAL
jgi:hypothetical protein